MSAVATLRATTKAGDIAWAVTFSLMGLISGLATGASAAGDTAGGVPALALGLLAVCALRYQFGSAPAALFWFDAARQSVPGATRSSLRAEAIRLLLFLSCLLLPMAAVGVVVGGWPGLAPMPAAIGVALAAIGIGALSAVMPYRWVPFSMLASLALVLVIVEGWIPTRVASLLAGGLVMFAICATMVALRLRSLLARGVDPTVGGDYAFVFSLGRHHGSAFTAPNSAPLAVLWQERHERASARPMPSGLDGRVRGLLGQQAWQLAVAPGRHALQWLGVIGLYPVIMLGFFAVLAHQGGGDTPFAGRQPLLLLVLVVLWGMVMGAAMQEQYVRGLRASRAFGDGLDAELRLLPGVAASKEVWARRLRPLWLPQALGLGGLVVGLALACGVAPMGVAVLALLAGLEAVRMRLAAWAALDGSRAASRLLAIAGAASGLLLLVALPVWVYGLAPPLDEVLARGLSAIGLDAVRLLAGVLVPILLLVAAARKLRDAGGSDLVREVAG